MWELEGRSKEGSPVFLLLWLKLLVITVLKILGIAFNFMKVKGNYRAVQWLPDLQSAAPALYQQGPLAPGQVAQLVRAWSGYAKVMGSIPSQGHIQELTNECINKWHNKLISLSLPHPSLPSSVSLKSIQNKNKRLLIPPFSTGAEAAAPLVG